MSDTFLVITNMEAVDAGARRGFRWFFTIDGPLGLRRVEVSLCAMLDYYAAQKELLRATGHVWRLDACEGRTRREAAKEWRAIVAAAFALSPSAPLSTPSPMRGVTWN